MASLILLTIISNRDTREKGIPTGSQEYFRADSIYNLRVRGTGAVFRYKDLTRDGDYVEVSESASSIASSIGGMILLTVTKSRSILAGGASYQEYFRTDSIYRLKAAGTGCTFIYNDVTSEDEVIVASESPASIQSAAGSGSSGGSISSSFTPAKLTNVLWWHPSYRQILTADQAVAATIDLSGMGAPGAQATGANQALFRNADKIKADLAIPNYLANGRSAIEFVSNDSYTIGGGGVGLFNNRASVGFSCVAYKIANTGTTQAIMTATNNAASTTFNLLGLNDTQILLNPKRLEADSSVSRTVTYDTLGKLLAITANWDFIGNKVQVWVNNVLVIDDIVNANAVGNSRNSNSQTMSIGIAPANGATGFRGYLFDHFACTQAFSEAERALIWQYQQQTFGIAA